MQEKRRKVPIEAKETTNEEKWEAIERLVNFIDTLPNKGGVSEVFIGGSFARGEAKPLSDVDIYLPTVSYKEDGLMEILFEGSKILSDIGVFLDIRLGDPDYYGDKGYLIDWKTCSKSDSSDKKVCKFKNK